MTTRRDAAEHEPVARAASEVIGGPSGRRVAHAHRRRGGPGRRRDDLVAPWLPVAAVLAPIAAVLVAGGVVQKRYCFDRGWGGPDVFWHACFSDLPRLYASSPLAHQGVPYASGGGLDQPVLTGMVLWVLSLFVPAGPSSQQWFTGLWAITAALCAMALVVVTVHTLRRDPWRAAQVACCPMLVTVALVSPDLVGMLLVAVGLWCWARERPLAAGLVLGAALAARSYAAFVLLVLGLVALRAGVGRDWCRCAGIAVLTWVGIVGLVQVTVGGALGPYAEWFVRPADYGSLWYLMQVLGRPVPAATATFIAIGGWALALAAGAFLTLGTRRRPAVAEVAVVVLVVAFLTAKSVPVQATFWLVPLVALARVPWRVYLLWMAAEGLYFVSVWLHIAGFSDQARALPPAWYGAALVLRLLALVLVAAHVVQVANARPAATRDEVVAESGADRRGDVDDLDGVDGDGGADGADLGDRAREARALAADPDELAGPAAGRPDALVVAFR